jgi:hypothetical protein
VIRRRIVHVGIVDRRTILRRESPEDVDLAAITYGRNVIEPARQRRHVVPDAAMRIEVLHEPLIRVAAGVTADHENAIA